ncbi:MAG: mucoidy inhibitor MuiA family protein [Prevotellaceae bacterium]|jgi:hypothetical protein|nr:mucoidy inhibitor MuiA family protein [Prevotellaceae bacterium]
MKRLLLCISILLVSSPIFADNDQIEVDAKLESATILQIGAELTHSAKVTLKPGTNELIIKNISSTIDANSLQVSCSGGVIVLTSEFSSSYLSKKEDSPEAKKLQDSIEACEKELTRLKTAIAINEDVMELLKANKKVGSEQSGLNVSDFIKMMEYYENKSVELQTERQNNQEQTKRVNEKLSNLRMQLEQERTKNNKVSNVLKLRLASPYSGSKDLTISYYTMAAKWTPFYDIQVFESDKPIKIIGKAKFMQTTGLDWKNVKLSLSTAIPNNGKTAPKFSTWFLQYQSPMIITAYGAKRYAAQNTISQNDISSFSGMAAGIQVQEQNIRIRGTSSINTDNEPLYVVNGVPMSSEEVNAIDPSYIKEMNVLNYESASALYGARAASGVILITLKDVNDYVVESESQTDFTYDIDALYDLPGNGKEQSVTLRIIELPAQFEYYCAPKLDKAVFLLANINDWEKYNLLPGETAITRDGTYIGKTMIDPYQTQKTLNLSLGTDKRIIVKREKLQDFSSTKFIGNSKLQVFRYQLTVKNNKTVPVQMVLKDQYPTSTRKDIEVEVLDKGNANIENEQVGVLTWIFTLQPGETKTVQHSYSIKYPKNESLNL